MFSTAQAIVDANSKTFDLLMIIALILFVVVAGWHITMKSFINAVWCAAFVFMSFAFLYLT